MNLETYWKRLVSACIEKRLALLPLGKTGRQVVWMVKSRVNVPGKSVLIAAGTHGDEIAGPLGILRFIEESDKYWLGESGLVFIPIVSPVAFKAGRRNGYTGRANSGYVTSRMGDKPSAEGKVLLENIFFISCCAENGFLTLHETDHEENFYLYYYGNPTYPIQNEMLNAFDMRDIGEHYFGCVPDRTRIYETGLPDNFVRGGIVYNQFDGSLEHALYTLGCPICICTETPGRRPIKLRVEATVALIKKFIDLRGGKQ